MKRGEIYRVHKGSKEDSKDFRLFVVVSRQILIDSKFNSVICAPIYSKYHGLSTQVLVGPNEFLKHVSAIHCDELISIPKNKLTNFISTLSKDKIIKLNEALLIALDII